MRLQDKQIMERLYNGDDSGLKELFDLYYKPLCIFALKYIDSIEQAEDIVQEIFVKFWNNKVYKNINSELRSYLFTAVKNNAINTSQRNTRLCFQEIEASIIDKIDDDLDDDEMLRLKQKLYKEIEELPPKAKDIFRSIVFENLKYKEVAALYNISVNTVKTQYSRALQRLRGALDILVLILLN